MDISSVLGIIAAFGGGTTLTVIIQEATKFFSGRAQRERERNNDIVAELADAKSDADEASRWEEYHKEVARRVGEHAREVRRIAQEHGIPLSTLPDFPAPPKEPGD